LRDVFFHRLNLLVVVWTITACNHNSDDDKDKDVIDDDAVSDDDDDVDDDAIDEGIAFNDPNDEDESWARDAEFDDLGQMWSVGYRVNEGCYPWWSFAFVSRYGNDQWSEMKLPSIATDEWYLAGIVVFSPE